MSEALERRYARLLREEERPLPDLVLVDGGLPQLHAGAGRARRSLGLGRPSGRTPWPSGRKSFTLPDRPGGIRLERTSAALKLVQHVRDEAHRFAVAVPSEAAGETELRLNRTIRRAGRGPPGTAKETDMILGIGVDMIEVARVQKVIERNPRFVDKVFSPVELAYSEGKKEPVSAPGRPVRGQGSVHQGPGARRSLDGRRGRQSSFGPTDPGRPRREGLRLLPGHVSLTHLAAYAVAVVVLDKE